MSKSELKTVIMRSAPFSAALSLLSNPYSLVPDDHVMDVRVVVEDASVRYAGGPGKQEMTGAAMVQSFCRAIAAAFANMPNLHTYVLLFDKKQYVPRQKGETQTIRRSTLEESAKRANVPAWSWDGLSNIIAMTKPLPPWPRLRLDGKAYGKALRDLVELIMQNVVPPPRCRIIFDWSETPMILESDEHGRAMTPYADVSLANTIGEADMAAQWYSQLGRCGGMSIPERPETHGIRQMDPELQAKYYNSDKSAAPTQAALRAEYEAGDVVLMSIDTDYLPLSILHFTLHPAHNVWLAIGKCSVTPGPGAPVFCTKTTKDAIEKAEIYNIRRLCEIVQTLHAPETPLLDAVASFVSFCTVCGNDYAKRPFGITHRIMMSAYKKAPIAAVWQRRDPQPPVISLSADAFRAFLLQCYWERLGTGNQPAGAKRLPPWETVASVVATTYTDARAHMPSQADLTALVESVCWAISYACQGPHGWSAVQTITA